MNKWEKLCEHRNFLGKSRKFILPGSLSTRKKFTIEYKTSASLEPALIIAADQKTISEEQFRKMATAVGVEVSSPLTEDENTLIDIMLLHSLSDDPRVLQESAPGGDGVGEFPEAWMKE